jgi:hypothetical protein
MASLASLFRGRQVSTARSEKRTTVATRQGESKRQGVDAAELKLREKWRKRRNRGVLKLRGTRGYQQLAIVHDDVDRAESYVRELTDLFDRARDAEIDCVRRFAIAHPESMPASVPVNRMVTLTGPAVVPPRIAPKPTVQVRLAVKTLSAPHLPPSSQRHHFVHVGSAKPPGASDRCTVTLKCV